MAPHEKPIKKVLCAQEILGGLKKVGLHVLEFSVVS